jgi:HD superfamily phosphohydrolase YqeK
MPPLPLWAVVAERRYVHILRVTELVVAWAAEMNVDARVRAAWRDAAAWHDALRDASPAQLGPPEVDPTLPEGAWHGPAAAKRLREDGERRVDVLEAITWHTVGDPNLRTTGRTLYCADFLEKGRRFHTTVHSALAARFPDDPAGVLRDVVRMRIDRAARKREALHPRTLAFWEAVR